MIVGGHPCGGFSQIGLNPVRELPKTLNTPNNRHLPVILMAVIDRDIHLATALVIDGNPTSRSVLAAQLRDIGVTQVRQVSRVQDARLVLESTPHDIVLCEMRFDGGEMSGQDLLDELRREQLLPYSTAFILITAEASYAQVMEAAEATVDGYLVKPCSGAVLAERLAEVRRRKKAMATVFEAIAKREFVRAAALAEQRYAARERYWSFSAQLAAELWLRAEQPARAAQLCNAFLAERPRQGWARAGVARAQLALGEAGKAQRLLENLVLDTPGYADGHDLLARLLVEQGDFEGALASFRLASELTPGCLVRMQHRGALAHYLGHADEAAEQFERCVAQGRRSKLFDPTCLVLLGLIRFDQGDARALGSVLDQLKLLAEPAGEERAGPVISGVRLARMRQVLAGLVASLGKRSEDALAQARALGEQARADDFDLEAAAWTLALWGRLPAADLPVKEFDTLLRTMGMRFCATPAATQMLAQAAGRRPLVGDTVRHCQGVIDDVAAQALTQVRAGDVAGALAALLNQGEQTGNARLIELAGNVLREQGAQLPDAGTMETMKARLQALLPGVQRNSEHIAGVRCSVRVPGAVVLRD